MQQHGPLGGQGPGAGARIEKGQASESKAMYRCSGVDTGQASETRARYGYMYRYRKRARYRGAGTRGRYRYKNRKRTMKRIRY